MYEIKHDPYVAAEHLLRKMKNPSHLAASVSTFYRPSEPLALKVFIDPRHKYLVNLVPDSIDGFDVLLEIAGPPIAD